MMMPETPAAPQSLLIPPLEKGRVAEQSEAGLGSPFDPHPARRFRGSPPSPLQGEG